MKSETILAPDGAPAEIEILQVGKPCPYCERQGVQSIAQGQFGGGAVCMRCGAQS